VRSAPAAFSRTISSGPRKNRKQFNTVFRLQIRSAVANCEFAFPGRVTRTDFVAQPGANFASRGSLQSLSRERDLAGVTNGQWERVSFRSAEALGSGVASRNLEPVLCENV